LVSDEEGEFFVTGVYSYGTRPEQKTRPDEVSRQSEALPTAHAVGDEIKAVVRVSE